MAWTLRPATPEDDALLFRLFWHGRNAELAASGWLPAQIDTFLRSQFALRESQYHLRFPAGSFEIVLQEGLPAGRLALQAGPQGIHLIDLALLPEHRGQGLGTELLEHLVARSQQASCPLTLQVDCRNPARRLYERMGFAYEATGGLDLPMRRVP